MKSNPRSGGPYRRDTTDPLDPSELARDDSVDHRPLSPGVPFAFVWLVLTCPCLYDLLIPHPAMPRDTFRLRWFVIGAAISAGVPVLIWLGTWRENLYGRGFVLAIAVVAVVLWFLSAARLCLNCAPRSF